MRTAAFGSVLGRGQGNGPRPESGKRARSAGTCGRALAGRDLPGRDLPGQAPPGALQAARAPPRAPAKSARGPAPRTLGRPFPHSAPRS